MEKVISITGKEYAYRDEEPIKGRNTAPCEERNFPDNEMGEDEEISFLKELLEQEESIQKECMVSQKITQKHRKCSVSAPHYEVSGISMQALERFAEQVGEKEKELLAILAIYAVTEYEEGELRYQIHSCVFLTTTPPKRDTSGTLRREEHSHRR